MSHHLDQASPTTSSRNAIQLPLPSRATLAKNLDRLSRLSLVLALVLSAWRYRWTLLVRPSPPVYDVYTDLLAYPGDLAILLALISWGLSHRLARNKLQMGPLFLSLSLAGVLLFAWLSVPFSIDPALSFYHSVRLSILAELYLLVANTGRDWRLLALAGALVVLSQAPPGLAQLLRQTSLGLQALGEQELDPARIGVSVVVHDGVRLLRAYGLTDHPNLLGGALAFSLILISAGYLQASRPGKTLFGAVFGLGLVGLLASFSRAGALALAAGLGLYGFLIWRRRPRPEIWEWLALMGASLIVLAPFLAAYAPYVASRAGRGGSFRQEATEQRSLQERAALNQATLTVLDARPIAGVGLGTLPLAIQDRFPDFPYYYQSAHLVLLEATAEIGIVGGLLLAGVLVFPWVALIGLARRRGRLPPGLIAASALLLALTVVGFFDYYPWLLQPGRIWLWLAWGLWACQYTDAIQGDMDG